MNKYFSLFYFRAIFPNALSLLLLLPAALEAAPGDEIFREAFSTNGDFNSDWNRSGSGTAMVSRATFNSSPRGLSLNGGTVAITSKANRINAAVNGAELSLWIRRGADSFSENPDAGEDLSIEYLNNNNVWTEIQRYEGNGTPGEIINAVFSLPRDALHNGLRLRITLVTSNGPNWDFWHIDDVVVTETGPAVQPTPIAHWRFDENAWSSSAGDVIDSQGGFHGHPYNGAQIGSASPARSGDPGTCNYGGFDGDNDYIEIPHNTALNGSSELTYMAWVRPDSWSGTRQIMAKSVHGGGSGRAQMGMFSESRVLRGRIETNRGRVNLDTSLPSTGVWTHLALVFDGDSLTWFINGIQSSQTTFSNRTLNQTNDPLMISKRVGSNQYFFDGLIDEVRVYTEALTAAEVSVAYLETRACGGSLLDHFRIDVGDGVASTCAPENISITAEDSDNQRISNYVGEITLSTANTNHGRWLKTTTPSDAFGNLNTSGGDDGAAVYTFDLTELDQGEITLQLDNTHAETLRIVVTDAAEGISTSSSNLTFSENTLVITNTDTLGRDIIAGRDHNFHVELVKRDPISGECGVATDYTQTNVKAWLSRHSDDPNGASPAITSAVETEILPDNKPVAPNLSLPFVDGEADFSLNTFDVGKFRFALTDESLTFSETALTDSSDIIIARPFAFDIQVAGNPASTDASGDRFTHSGNNFTVSARAVLWDSGDDLGSGIPMGHSDTDPSNNADLSNNASALSFGLESPSANVVLSASLVLPAPNLSRDPGLSDGDTSAADGRVLKSFTSGIASTSSVFFDEVGIIEIAAEIVGGDYLGAGTALTQQSNSLSGFVGRFAPATFSLIENEAINGVTVQSEVIESCDTFSYMGDFFNARFYLSALSSQGTVTTNYRGDFAKLTNTDSFTFSARDTETSTDLSTRVFTSSIAVDWASDLTGNSVIDYGYAEVFSTLILQRDTAPDGDFQDLSLGVVPLESTDNTTIPFASFDLDANGDGVNDTALIDETPSAVRFGRLRLADAFGPEATPLPVTFVTEYWNGSHFILNTSDSCTTIASSEIIYPDGDISTAGNRQLEVGGGTTTGNYSDPDIDDGSIAFTMGSAGQFFSAPGEGNTGAFNVDVNLDFYPWLRHDWNQDADYNNDDALPTATFTFGRYRGHDRVIYWREVLE